MTIQTHKRTCSLCEATCGIEIEFNPATEEILSIKGDKSDPFSRGYICPKATALQDLQNDPDRLRTPLKKTASGWQEISWSQALNEAAEGFRRIQAGHGRDAVGSYLGNPNVHNYGNMIFGPLLLKQLGSKNKFSATSVDQLPHHMASLHMFGHQLQIPVPDIDRTDFLIVMGGNPLASNGSLMTAPDIKNRLKAIRERGGKILVIDPRRSETAGVADEHWFIRPGQDVLLLLSLLYVFTHELSAQLPALPEYIDSADLAGLCAAYAPENTAARTGIEASQVRALAAQWLQAKSAVCYGRMGVSVQQYGGLCQWLINVLNIVSGNFDRAGGAMFTSPAVDIVGITAAQGGRGHFDRYRSRVRNLPEFGGELPVAVLAEEILTPGKGQIRGMLTVAGNPLLSTPNSRQLERAFESLDFMVSVDYFLNETSRHADLILPPCGPLERDHYDVIFNALAVRNVAKYSTALFKPKPGVLQDWQILLQLTKRLNRGDLKKRLINRLTWVVMGWLKPEGVLNKMLKSGKSGLDLNALKKQPEGVDLGALQPVMPKRLFTRDKRLNLTPEVYLNALAEVASELQQPLLTGDQLLLIGRRHIRSNNSWLHNSKRLVKGKSRCTLMLNPADAERLGIADGVSVRVSSRVAELDVVAEVTDELMPGVVSIPHGWGHGVPGIRLRQAQEVAGVNTNDLTDDQLLDGLTGNAALNGVAVTLTAVA
ncbi:molybdopterin oxidoreductase family protein [Thalassolituus hydrocarboniclasticus]|uniref:Molybdopterin-dependent oxidoreductase n=1 Tax=Thalassolituus hydrocarboniclasticus TaxID=2742796 RepID=A0ABY6A9F8_9GAMM|nr:molybdopterin oxidoreductase family protein [Thalassolituus hydrocarboniclasticus]UXD87651.1 molybdopterin-dependent oxidoreductase [Thalassolituus hydrocarboniclasticus]